jgi:hypothetical protein
MRKPPTRRAHVRKTSGHKSAMERLLEKVGLDL